MIRVVVVDDQDLVRAGLRALLEHEADIQVVGEAGEGRAALARVGALRPDVVLMDLRMPVLDGASATAALRDAGLLERSRVLVLTTFDEDEEILAAVAAGAAGYLLKDIAAADLRRAVRIVAAGDNLLAPAVTRRVMERLARLPPPPEPPPALASLTARERAVLVRLGHGETNAEIGRALHISPATARTYVSRIIAKLQARDRTQLAVIANRSGLVDDRSDSAG
ncbi:response regulator [Streptomyces profundus]|uniref:response regulator n=1 Tax=Streptomyces profundus TaxID=2867410 RepID=UPI001D15F0F7|nr:response regulator transcription factor [Streptomyces sp. MA3_2.13]UED87756.1 response regulator transcription factor [Streptomyces sp. MA3_2.13]